jgi:hypothetical protein
MLSARDQDVTKVSGISNVAEGFVVDPLWRLAAVKLHGVIVDRLACLQQQFHDVKIQPFAQSPQITSHHSPN